MDSLTQNDLKALMDAHGEWCVSLFIPTVRAGAEVQQNQIRFKNLLRRAADELAALELRTPDIEALLAPAEALLDDPEVWRNTGDGLAVFVCDGDRYTYRLPIQFQDLAVVERRFHIKPLLPLLSGDGQFYVLALSQDGIRLLEGTRDSVHEVDLEGVPDSVEEAAGPEAQPFNLRAAPGAPPRGAGQYGQRHGVGEEATKQDILRYFHRLDHALRDRLADRRVPLVLAGVDYLLPLYREANTYPALMDEGLTGSPQALSNKELHARAWEIVQPHYERAEAEQREQYLALAGRGDERASHDLKTVVRAAHDGRIATLFVAFEEQQPGVYRSHSHNVHVHPEEQPGDQDLLDLAAAQTIVNGGQVYVVERGDVPGGKAFAAIFRY